MICEYKSLSTIKTFPESGPSALEKAIKEIQLHFYVCSGSDFLNLITARKVAHYCF